jgi:hypothetical protein
MKKILFAFLGVFLLSGCDTPAFKEFMKDLTGPARGNAPAPAPASYCYSTLGSVTCYDNPLPEDEQTKYVGTTAQPIDTNVNQDQVKGPFSTTAPEPAPPSVDMQVPEYQIQTPAEPAPPPPPVIEPPKPPPPVEPIIKKKPDVKPVEKKKKAAAKPKAAKPKKIEEPKKGEEPKKADEAKKSPLPPHEVPKATLPAPAAPPPVVEPAPEPAPGAPHPSGNLTPSDLAPITSEDGRK